MIASATSAALVPGFVSVALGVPIGFLIGWRAGWNEHVVRARADRKAGLCSECLRPMHSVTESSRHRDEIDGTVPDDLAGGG